MEDETTVRAQAGAPVPPEPRPPEPRSPDIDRLAVLEQQVRQLTSRLASWVEAQLVDAVDDRRRELGVLRAELEVVVREQLAALRGEVDALRSAGGSVAGSRGPGPDVEQRVRQAMMRLTESFEAQLAELASASRSEADALRAEVTAQLEERVLAAGARTSAGLAAMQDRVGQRDTRFSERLDVLGAEVASAAAGVAALSVEAESNTQRTEAFEQRVKAAMGRLSDSVEARLAETATTRQNELERFRSDLVARMEEVEAHAARTGEAAARVEAAIGVGAEQVGVLQQQLKAALERASATVDAQLAEQAVAATAEAATWRAEIEASVAREVAELRGEIVAGANAVKSGLGRAFARLDAVEAAAGESGQQLEERLRALADQLGAAAGTSDVLGPRVEADAARIDALELHTRRTDAKLGELVEEKYAQLADERGVELARFRAEMEAGAAAELERMRAEVSATVERARQDLADAAALVAEQRAASEAALAAELANVRDATAALLDAAREDVAARSARLEGQGAEMQAAMAAARAEARAELAATLDATRLELAARAATLDARHAELAERAPELATLAGGQAELAESLHAVERRASRADDRIRGKLSALSERIEGLAAALERAASTESGALAPLRSDVRALQAQVAELVAASAGRPRSPAKKAAAPVPPKRAATRARRPI